MSKRLVPDSPSSHALELFQPKPNSLYNLDTASYLAGVPRRSILIYCRTGLIRPIFQPPYGMMKFTEETIHTIRRIEYYRSVHGLQLDWIKSMFDLAGQVERLQAELNFLRNH